MALANLQKPMSSASSFFCCLKPADDEDEEDILLDPTGTAEDKPKSDDESKLSQSGGETVDAAPPLKKADTVVTALVPVDLAAARAASVLPETRSHAAKSAFGHLDMAIEYDARTTCMVVEVIKLVGIRQDLFEPEQLALDSVQIRLALLPAREMRTKSAPRSLSKPEFNETYTFKKVQANELADMGIRVRAYRCLRHRRDQLVAEAYVSFLSMKLINPENKKRQKVNMSVKLEAKIKPPKQVMDPMRIRIQQERENNNKKMKMAPLHAIAIDAVSLADRSSISDLSSVVSGSTLSLRVANSVVAPEIMLGLAYNALTGRLTVEIKKATKMNGALMKGLPDPYMKVLILNSDGEKLNESRTKVRTETANPTFDETFLFDVPSFKLSDVTMMVSAYNNKARTKKRAILGWISMGAQNSAADQVLHWNEMKGNKGQIVTRWHTLLVA